jgi:hypothetical protein
MKPKYQQKVIRTTTELHTAHYEPQSHRIRRDTCSTTNGSAQDMNKLFNKTKGHVKMYPKYIQGREIGETTIYREILH